MSYTSFKDLFDPTAVSIYKHSIDTMFRLVCVSSDLYILSILCDKID